MGVVQVKAAITVAVTKLAICAQERGRSIHVD
jgi:hypothetical protein